MTWKSALAGAALAVALAGCGPDDPGRDAGMDYGGAQAAPPKDGAREATLVRTGRFRQGEIRTAIDVSTDIEAEYVVDVFPKVGPAYVKQVLVLEGDPVEAGQPLLLLDEVDFAIEVRRRESELIRARGSVEQMRVAESQARASERAAHAAFEKAQLDRKRAVDAMEGDLDVLSERELSDLEAAFQQRQAENEAATFAVEKATTELELAKLEVKAAEIELEAANNDLEQTTVRAPITGVVQRRDVNAGLLVSSSSHLFTLVDPSRLIANLPIPQEDLHRVTRLGIPVEFQFDALPGQTFIGAVEAMNPSVDPASGLIRVRARLPEQAVGLVRPGMFARARIVIESRADAVLVSKRAVAYDEGRAYVFSTAGGVARKHLIEVGASTEDELEVVLLDGAAPDLALDLIVVGQDNLRDGDPVAVTAAAAESAS